MRKRTNWLFLSIFAALVTLCALATIPEISQSQAQNDDVIISEVAWSGTAASEADEWIELHNRGHLSVDLEGWRLIGSNLNVALSGSVGPYGFFLLERTDEDTVSDIQASQIYIGALSNAGDALTLSNSSGAVVDSANSNGGPWPAGTLSPEYRSMERVNPWSPDLDTNWLDNNVVTRNGHDSDGNPINGTPGRPNSQWSDLPGSADLVLSKSGPAVAFAGTEIVYSLSYENIGELDAAGVILTDTLPGGFGYMSDSSGFPPVQPDPSILAWHLGVVPTGTRYTFNLTVTIASDYLGTATNEILIRTEVTETMTYNNYAVAETNVITPGSPLVLIDAVYYDGYETNEPDEAVRLVNIGGGVADLSGWALTDGLSSVYFPDLAFLPPGESLWVSKNGAAFLNHFGFFPGYETIDSHTGVPDLIGSWPGFSNVGDEVILRDSYGQSQDALVYEEGDINLSGWSGPAVNPYTVPGVFAEEGQILYRIRDQLTGLQIPDTNQAADWAQQEGDVFSGRKVQYPGWDIDQFFQTLQISETANFVIAIAPDNAYNLIAREINKAQNSIKVATYTFRHAGIGDSLVAALSRGVSVTILLEGGPGGGIDDQEKYICMKLEEAGGQCWFMINDEDQDIHDRYRNYHAKYMIFDNQSVLISTENLSPDSLPDDDKSDGTWGRRGIVLMTDSNGVREHMQSIWEVDLDASQHRDLFRWTANHPLYGNPPSGMVPITATGGTSYTIRYPAPIGFIDRVNIEVIQSPENSLRNIDGLLGLLRSTGEGDTILAEQLYEPPYWGAAGSDPNSDPNLRLKSMLDAARRGVKVRLLLDEFFDDPTSSSSNWSTCRYANEVAASEGLNFRCALGNPTGLGLHNKMVLVERNGAGFIHIGSLNGSELSSKGNREIALQIQSNEAFELLKGLFEGDWPNGGFLPIVFNSYKGPSNHVLISEVLYNPYGMDDAEFVEIANPTGFPIDLSGFSLGDALYRYDFEDVRLFPDLTIIGAGETIVIATTATGFNSLFGFSPDFEILDTDPLVKDLIDNPDWGDPDAFLQLGNLGDEVIIRNRAEEIVDAIGYGQGSVPGIVSCHLVASPNHSLERYPSWRDTDNCLYDFRDWPFPNPGDLP